MRILLVTQTYEGASGWHIERTLRKMGHTVHVNDPGNWIVPPYKGHYSLTEYFRRQIVRVINRLPPVRSTIIAANNRRLLHEAQTFQPDLLLVIKGEQIYPEAIARIRTSKTCAINWCFDDPFMWIRNPEEAIAAYDHFLVVDSTYIEKAHQRIPNAKLDYLPQCCDPAIHRTVALTSAEQAFYGNAVCLVGSMYHHRVNSLDGIHGFDVGIWGEGWKKSSDPFLKKSFRGRAVFSSEKTKVFNASKVILNTHHPQAIRGTNLRTYEVTGCGAFLLSDRREDLLRLYTENEEFVGFEDTQDLHEKITFYLAHPEERAHIATRGQRRAHAEHTYEIRLNKLLALVH